MVIFVPADGLAPFSARPSIDTMMPMSGFGFNRLSAYTQMQLKG